MIQWLRTNGYVLSRVFQEAAARLMGGGELDRLEQQIEHHKEQVTILEAAKATLASRNEVRTSVETKERERLEAIQQLAEVFFAQGRDGPQFHRVNNLKWIQGRIASSKVLRGSRPDDTLDLVLSLKRAGGIT